MTAMDYVVSDNAVAQLRGKSARQRAGELIAIAHPTFRAELTQQARRLNLVIDNLRALVVT